MELCHVKSSELDLRLGRLRQIPEAAIKAMASSLERKGQLSPLVAASRDGALVLVDGFIRTLAAERLGLDTLLVEVAQLSTVQMKAQLYLRNQDRALGLLEQCRLVFELAEADGLSQVEIGELLERHKSWVCRRLALYRNLSPHLLEEHALGRLGAGSLRRLARLQARNQDKLFAVGRAHALGAREMAQFLDLYERARDPAARSYLLAQPREALQRARAKPGPPPDPRLGEAGRRLLAGLHTLCEVSSRLQRRVDDGIGELAPEGVELLDKAYHRAQQLSSQALCTVGGWLKARGGSLS